MRGKEVSNSTCEAKIPTDQHIVQLQKRHLKDTLSLQVRLHPLNLLQVNGQHHHLLRKYCFQALFRQQPYLQQAVYNRVHNSLGQIAGRSIIKSPPPYNQCCWADTCPSRPVRRFTTFRCRLTTLISGGRGRNNYKSAFVP